MRVLELTDGIKNIINGFAIDTSDIENKKWTLSASDAVFLPILGLDIKTLRAFTGEGEDLVHFDADYKKDAEGYHLILNVYLAGILNDNLSAEITSEEDFMSLDVAETKANTLPENWKELITTDMLKEYAEENGLILIEDEDRYKEDLFEDTDMKDFADYKSSYDVRDFVADYVRDNLG